MPQRVNSQVRTYVYSLWAVGGQSFFGGDDRVASMTLFLENGDRIFLYFHADTTGRRAPAYSQVGTMMHGHVLLPASRLDAVVDLLRNETALVILEVEDEEIVAFQVSTRSEPAGEGELSG